MQYQCTCGQVHHVPDAIVVHQSVPATPVVPDPLSSGLTPFGEVVVVGLGMLFLAALFGGSRE